MIGHKRAMRSGIYLLSSDQCGSVTSEWSNVSLPDAAAEARNVGVVLLGAVVSSPTAVFDRLGRRVSRFISLIDARER